MSQYDYKRSKVLLVPLKPHCQLPSSELDEALKRKASWLTAMGQTRSSAPGGENRGACNRCSPTGHYYSNWWAAAAGGKTKLAGTLVLFELTDELL